jgi:signal transduction histidine kinase
MSTAQEQLAAQRMLSVTEQELQRIILDIHDGPVQQLFAALTQLNVMQQQIQHDSANKADWSLCVQRVSALIEASLGEIRTVLGALRPPEFARRNMPQLLQGLVVQHMELTGMQVHLCVEGEIPALTLPVKIALYRITQEALANVYRHANVRQATVHLSAHRGTVRLLVSDDGRGFTPPPLAGPTVAERAEHIGLRGMRERMTLVGGTFTVESSPGKGTTILVEVPADESAQPK